MKFNKDLLSAIENNNEGEIIRSFKPLVNKLTSNNTIVSTDDLQQELNIEIMEIYRSSRDKLERDFVSYLNKLNIFEY
jgi:hypothetical protein